MIFKQPKPFYLIFFLELFERFGFYSLQSIILIYLVKKMLLSEFEAINIYTSFNALMYGMVVIGGWIGDKLLGVKRTLFLGIINLIIGYTIIFINLNNINWIYIGLSIIAIGNCLFKPSPSIILSNIYKKYNKQIDSGFTIYYMAVNIGSLLSILITPLIYNKFGWKISFLIPILGPIFTLISYLIYNNIIYEFGSKLDYKPINKKILFILLISLIISPIFISYFIKNIYLTNIIINFIILSILIIFIKEILFLNNKNKKRMIVAFILIIEAIIYFILYNQIPTSLNFFTIKNVESNIFGININPIQFQALNPFWIIIFSPILSKIYNIFGNKLSIIYKFAIGMTLSSISFLIIPIGIYLDTNNQGLIPSYWLILSYLFQSIGELMISGLGLSMISQLVPKKLINFTLGSWFLTTSISSILSGKIANIMSIPKDININKFQLLNIYFNSFIKIGVYSGIIAIFMLISTSILDSIIKNK